MQVLRHFLQGLAKRQLRAVTLSQLADAALAGRTCLRVSGVLRKSVVIDSRMAVKSRRWPGLDGASTQAVAAWPDPGAELREEQGLVLEGCTASVSSDEMRALNELGYAGRNRHELLESFDVPPLLASVHGCPQHRPSTAPARERSRAVNMKAALTSIGILLALLGTSLLCWPQQPRRLLTLSLSWTSSPLDAGWVTAENPEDDFNRWMSNAGLAATSQQGPASLRDRLALRILAFAVDVLPPSVLKDYADELSQVSGIDLAAMRPLTQSEEMIKEALAQQASSGESLASSGGYSYWGFLPYC
eukprot:s2156_g18.t5